MHTQKARNLKNRIKLDRISEASSPQASKKQIPSPQKTTRGRVMMGGMGDSYLSFYKIQNELEQKYVKISSQLKKSEITKHSIAEKDHAINNLQQTIMKQTVKKNARQKCFQERLTTDWKKHIEHFIQYLTKICIQMSKKDHSQKETILRIVYQCCNKKAGQKKKAMIILAWILQWLRPILKMMHQVIRKKYN